MSYTVTSVAKSVGTSSSILVDSGQATDRLTIQNLHATQDLYIGGSDVTTANGLKIAAGTSRDLEAFNGTLYGIASGATTDVRVLKLA